MSTELATYTHYVWITLHGLVQNLSGGVGGGVHSV